jgi:hypothetical protein
MQTSLIRIWKSGRRAERGDASPLPFLRPFRPTEQTHATPRFADHGLLVRACSNSGPHSLGAVVAGIAVLIVIAASLGYLLVTLAPR